MKRFNKLRGQKNFIGLFIMLFVIQFTNKISASKNDKASSQEIKIKLVEEFISENSIILHYSKNETIWPKRKKKCHREESSRGKRIRIRKASR